MFFLPGSWYVGRCLEAFLAHEYAPWELDWEDHDRRGAGSILMVLGALAGLALLIAYAAGAFA